MRDSFHDMLRACPLVLCLGLSCGLSYADAPRSPADEPGVVDESGTRAEKPGSADGTGKSGERTRARMKKLRPADQIQADQIVPFPADI